MNDKQKAIARVLAEHMEHDDVRAERIRDEADGAACAALALAGICAGLVAFVVAVIWWGPR